MKVEFTGRFSDRRKKTEEEKHLDYTQSLINPNYEPDRDNVVYTYDPITLDLDDVRAWIRVDRVHTQLNMEKGDLYIIKLPYLFFSKLYEDMTGKAVRVVEFSQEELKSSPYQSEPEI